MATDIQKRQKSEKRFPKFANFGEYLFWSYANLQMLLLLMARERQQKSWKLKPIIKKLLEIEPDKLELVKMIINYK